MSGPFNPQAEESVIGQMLAQPRLVGQVVGTLLEPAHFALPAMRALYGAILDAYYDDTPSDALTIGEHCAKTLARTWGCEETEAVDRVRSTAARTPDGLAVDHARLIKRDHDYRALLSLAEQIRRDVQQESGSPDEVASAASQAAMQIATSTLLTQEIISFEQLGRNWIREQRRIMATAAAGMDVGCYFGLEFLDAHLRGLKPSELFFLAGEPGAGKSAVAWKAAERFAERQAKHPPDRRVGALVLSLEMPEGVSAQRYALSMSGVDSGRLREGRNDEADLQAIIDAWRRRRDLPLYHNFSSNMRLSQLRAMVVEAIRRHNTGLVVIDHWKYLDTDRSYRERDDADEAKARFLKQDIAKQLNVAVICLAHTTKSTGSRDDPRPRMGDLRGSGYIAAHADFVGFVYRPYKHATAVDKATGTVLRTDAELLWEKTRHSGESSAEFFFDASTMTIR